MDFHALPRRDLQALCKRNGVRANMTNVAMADALGALPMVDGIEEYVQQPTAVPAPAVAQEEVRREKQGSPLPRGRRVTAKTSEVLIKDEVKEEEKAEDAPPLGAARRGAGRRARPTPAAALSVAETAVAEEEKQFPRARRATLKSSEPTKQNGGDEDEKMEANHESNKEEDVPAIGMGRRGANRRARPAPAAATAAAEPAVKTAAVEDKQGIPPPRARRGTVKSSQPDKLEDEEEETENLKLAANKEDAPAKGGVRRGPSRRARPAPVASKPAAKSVVEEELGSPLPRRRHGTANVTSSAPICAEDVPPLDVGRRGVSRRAQPEPVAAPVAEVATEVAEPDDGEVEDKEDPKLEEKEEDFTAHGVVPRGRSQRTRLAPVEAPATRRKAAATTTEERNVTLETAPNRPTRQRRPTMKAAAAEEMAPQRAIKKTAARNSALQQGNEQEESIGVMSDSVSVPTLASNPQKKVQNEVMDEPKQDDDKEPAMNVDEMLVEENLTELPPVADQECADKSPLQEQQVEVKCCPTPLLSQDDSPILGLLSSAAGQVVEEDDAGTSDGLLKNEIVEEIHHAGEEMELAPAILALRASLAPDESIVKSGFTSHAARKEMESSNEVAHGTDEISEVSSEDGLCQEKGDVADCEVLPSPMEETVALDCSGYISTVDEKEAVESMVSQLAENEAVTDDIVSSFRVMDDKVVEVEKPEELVTKEDVEENNFQTDFVCVHEQMEVVNLEKAEKVSDKLPQSKVAMDEDIEENDFQTDFLHVDELKEVIDMEKVEIVTNSLPKSTTILDEDVQEVDFQTDCAHVNTADNALEVTTTDGELVEQEKILQQSTDTVVKEDILDDKLESDFVHADKVPELIGTDGEVDEENKAAAITEEMPESIGSMDECVKDHFEIGFVQADELKKVIIADSLLDITETEDGDVQNDLPQELDIPRDPSDNVTSALLDSVNKSLSKITIHEPMVSQDKDKPMCMNSSDLAAELVCKDSSDKNTDEPLCKIRSESNTAEPVAMEENRGLNVAKKSADLNKLSLGQLKAKLKKKLKRKEEKRVALARVDENVCRSNATGQERVHTLQLH